MDVFPKLHNNKSMLCSFGYVGLNIAFDDDFIPEFTRVEAYNWSDFLSNCGSFFGKLFDVLRDDIFNTSFFRTFYGLLHAISF